MGKRKFFHSDAVHIIQGDCHLHYGHAGEVVGTRISIFPHYRRVAYAVACECGAVIRTAASDMDALERDWPGISDARVQYVYAALGITPVPADAEARLDESLTLLPYRDREVLVSRCGLQGRTGRSLEEIGRDLGVSRERIRQIEARARRRLRAHLQGGTT